MVKKTFYFTLAVFVSLVNSIFSGEFTADVNSKDINLGESFTLNLTLKDSSSKGDPDLSILQKHFAIHSQQKFISQTIVNGSYSSNNTWTLTLTSLKEGAVQIPAIVVDTTEGPLSTQEIILNVTKGSGAKSSANNSGLNISAKVSNTSPYKNEPFFYTAILSSKTPLYNIQTQKLQVENAIVELIEKPKLEQKFVEGTLQNVVEFTYLITPLKAESLIISPIIIQGAIPHTRNDQFNHSSPFGFMQGFDPLKPFNLMTDEIKLNVLPAIAEISPWLPAKALTIEEQWPSDQVLRVGEPISRGFVIKAEGLKVSQLPRLEDLQDLGSAFKVYADKPDEQENVQDGVIVSSRKEQYTLIPQKAGKMVLPEFSITWWDTVRKKKKVTTVAARTIEILAGSPIENGNSSSKEGAAAEDSTHATTKEVTSANDNLLILLYSIIGGLMLLLGASVLWGVSLHKKLANLTKDQAQKPISSVKPVTNKPTFFQSEKKDKQEKLPDLNPT